MLLNLMKKWDRDILDRMQDSISELRSNIISLIEGYRCLMVNDQRTPEDLRKARHDALDIIEIAYNMAKHANNVLPFKEDPDDEL